MTWVELQNTYKILGKIGSGSGGIIILAEHRNLKQKVILKRIIQPSGQSWDNRREADILKQLRHESLPVVYDFIEIRDGSGKSEAVFTVMDYIEGESLDQKAETGQSFSLNELRRWGSEIASALSVLHEQNPPILHLDIKPANIMVRTSGKAVLIDFNVSLSGQAMARTGYSENFCSPEQKQILEFSRKHRIAPELSRLGESSDLYSLGATLYFLAMGRYYDPAFPQWETVSEKYVPEFAAILEKCLKQNPADRYQSAKSLKADLDGMSAANKKMVDWERRVKIRSRICYAGLCTCICLLGFSFYLMRSEKQDLYNSITDRMVQARNDADFGEVENLFNEAWKMQPSTLKAYYEKAASLHDQGKYKEASDFIQSSILSDERMGSLESGLENTYYLLADSLYQQKLYEESAGVYEDLFEMEKLQPVFYRDYAITLGYNKEFDKASDILEKAAARGLDNASLTYANAEISYAKEEVVQAIAMMNEALKELEEDSVRMHAYAKIAEWDMEARQYADARKTLLQARADLPTSLLPAILQTLVQADSKLADTTKDPKYQQEAIGAIQEIIDNGWAVYSDYNNMAVFYQKLGQIDQAEQVVADMEDQYGADYNTYKRRAFLEIDRQELRPNENRNYAKFEELYRKAKNEFGSKGDDFEMPLLDSLHQDLQKGGWI